MSNCEPRTNQANGAIGRGIDKTIVLSASHYFDAQRISLSVSILDDMNSHELEALAAELHAQMERGSKRSEEPKIELEDVKGWLAYHKKQAESYSELSFFLNLV